MYIGLGIALMTTNTCNQFGATKKGGGVVNLRFDLFLNFLCINMCLLVWDSGLQLMHVN